MGDSKEHKKVMDQENAKESIGKILTILQKYLVWETLYHFRGGLGSLIFFRWKTLSRPADCIIVSDCGILERAVAR